MGNGSSRSSPLKCVAPNDLPAPCLEACRAAAAARGPDVGPDDVGIEPPAADWATRVCSNPSTSPSDFSTDASRSLVSGEPTRGRLSGGELGRDTSTRELLLLALLLSRLKPLAVGLLPFLSALFLSVEGATRSSDCDCTVPARARPVLNPWSAAYRALVPPSGFLSVSKADRGGTTGGMLFSASKARSRRSRNVSVLPKAWAWVGETTFREKEFGRKIEAVPPFGAVKSLHGCIKSKTR